VSHQVNPSLSFGGVPLLAGASSGTGDRSTSTTTSVADPFQKFLANFVLQQSTQPSAQVQPFTTDALRNSTATPAPVNPATQQALSRITSNPSFIDDSTSQAIQRLTTNPATPFNQFQALVDPLLASLRPGEERGQRDLQDLFRKSGAGSLKSGAFATSARELIGEQGSRRNQLLAANFLPISQQLSGLRKEPTTGTLADTLSVKP